MKNKKSDFCSNSSYQNRRRWIFLVTVGVGKVCLLWGYIWIIRHEIFVSLV